MTLRDDGFLDVVLRVNDDVKVPKNSLASVKPVGIFGDAAIALTPKGPSPVSYSPGDTVPVGPSRHGHPGDHESRGLDRRDGADR